MGYYDIPANVETYIKMADGYDGRAFIPILQNHLKQGATILELGMGPGKDLELLGEHFQVTGSDYSTSFLERYQKDHPHHDLIQVDARTMNTERQFDCIYSNKVLYHLSRSELTESFRQQASRLNKDGILFHTFWFGDSEEEMEGLQFVYYTKETILPLIGGEYNLIAFEMYTEMETDDSFYIILQKTSH